ncbi:pseudouridine synthase [Neolewinella aurantiaca]|uniref:Pseudouridine synthase n=1 Tax=Neolewinella aurantiaca TaxID=2602767 RepID=A0A5C7FT69_9BACT|nr:pseudouridine synthase [Neolewinella aurantiaca]TXF88585.1 pseudouridine synthase [Neolewinella aurantiaca]
MPCYYLINKPYGMLSQFTREAPGHRVLGDLFPFPKDVYPVGRLDRDSEGLLILTNDRKLNEALLHPKNKHGRTYWARVEGVPDPEKLRELERGVTIRAKGKTHQCAPLRTRILSDEETENLPERVPPVRYRKSVPDAWLELTLTEGKNRQVRKMCAAVGLPVLRLIRVGIESLSLSELAGETVKEVDSGWLMPKIGLKTP